MSIMVVHWLHPHAQRVWIGLFLVSLSEGLTTCVGSAYYLLFEKYSVFGLYNSAHSLCKKLRTHWWSSWIVVELSCTTLTQPLIATSMNFRYTCEDQQFSSCWLHALFRGWTLACLQFGNLSNLGGSDTAISCTTIFIVDNGWNWKPLIALCFIVLFSLLVVAVTDAIRLSSIVDDDASVCEKNRQVLLLSRLWLNVHCLLSSLSTTW